MHKKLMLLSLLLCLCLFGCGKAEEDVAPVEPVEDIQPDTVTYLHQPADSYTWDNITFSNLFPASSYEESDDALNIFPCYSKDAYISIEKILISSNDFWDNVVTQYSSTENIMNLENYSYVTSESGETIGYLPIDETHAYTVRSSTLPSGYVDYVLSYLDRPEVH